MGSHENTAVYCVISVSNGSITSAEANVFNLNVKEGIFFTFLQAKTPTAPFSSEETSLATATDCVDDGFNCQRVDFYVISVKGSWDQLTFLNLLLQFDSV